MASGFEWRVALRYLRSRRREGFISVIAWFSLLGICLGVATLIIVMAVMNGFRHDLLSRVLGVSGHVTVTGLSRPLSDDPAMAARIAAQPGVALVTPLVTGQVMASAPGGVTGARARGMRAADFGARPALSDTLTQGSLAGFDAGEGILLGHGLARRLGVGAGDAVTLLTPDGPMTPFGVLPRSQSWPVAGVFRVGMHEYDSAYIYMPLRAAQDFFGMDGRLTGLEVHLDNPDAAPDAASAMRAALGGGVAAIPWQRTNATFFSALEVERNVMFLILTLIIVVAAFNVISGQIMLVTDKTAGIAIMRTMGASRASVLRIFFMTGSAIGVIGTAAGVALGVAFAANIEAIRQWLESVLGVRLFPPEVYLLATLPARIEPGEVAGVAAMALVLSFLASAYPAWRAARMDPVAALRHA